MRILFYANSLAPAGGVERVISKHITFLEKHHEIILLTKDSVNSFYPLPSNVLRESLKINFHLNLSSRVQRISTIFLSIIKSSWKLHKYLDLTKPDVVYVATPLNLLELQIANLLSQRFSIKNVCVTEHSSYRAYNFVYKSIIQLLYPRVGLLLVPTRGDHALYSAFNIRSHYLANPLPFDPILSSNHQNKTVLNVGRLTDDKQHSVLLNIWSKTKFREGWILKIIGEGENYLAIKSQIARLGIESSVQLCPVTKNIEAEYASASIFALSSRAEGFGLVILEAMACGLPCIAFDCPTGPRDIIENERSGYLIQPEDQVSYIKSLETLLESYSLRKTMGQNAKQSIHFFSSQNVALQLNALIDSAFKLQKIS
jgi:glycosyltransferase involved in cell wall biosynthesis